MVGNGEGKSQKTHLLDILSSLLPSSDHRLTHRLTHVAALVNPSLSVNPWGIRARTVFPSDSAGKEFACSSGVQETQVRSLGQEDPLEKEMATHSNIFAWEIPRTEEPGGRQSRGCRVGRD